MHPCCRNTINSIMKKNLLSTLSCAMVVLTVVLRNHPALAQGTVFTYQGRLDANGSAASGYYDFRFRLASDEFGNTYIGSPVLTNGVSVLNGLFTTTLDFGEAFDGSDLWLQVDVRTNGTGGYTALNPLQRFTATPYAQRAANAARIEGQPLAFVQNADNLTAGTLADARIPASITRDSEVMGIVLANDGPGSGLDADTLNGYSSSAFLKSSGLAAITGTSTMYPILRVTQNGTESGLQGFTVSTNSGKAGVVGQAGAAGPLINSVAGVFGTSSSGRGVIGSSLASNGLFGHSSYGIAIKGESLNSTAIEASSFDSSGTAYGLKALHNSINGGAAVFGESPFVALWGDSSGRWGVYGRSTGTSNSYGIYGTTVGGPGNYAGYFSGNVHVTGTLSKGGGSFKIDHPLDPENKFLSHSFVESPDMMNIYNGNVILNAEGEAWVRLPEYFQALNRDFRYQLTPVGGPGPNLHIADTVQNNRFRIAGGTPRLQVSWQITGIRQDAFANANRIVVEEPKQADERGSYLHPEAYDKQLPEQKKTRKSLNDLREPRANRPPSKDS